MGSSRAGVAGRGLRTPVRGALSCLLAASALLGTAAGATASAPAAAPAAVPAAAPAALAAPATDLATQKRQVVEGINAERAARGRAPLTEFGDVSAVSQRWAEAQAASGQYRHNPDFAQQLAGYAGIGEIIHLSYSNSTDGAWAVRGWIDSAKHHEIMLGDYTGMGVGIAVGPARVPNAQTEIYYVVNTVKGTRPSTTRASAPVASATWTNGGAVHRLQGAILGLYQGTGGPGGVLGLPTTSELSTPDGVGRFTHFERGSIYFSPATGAQVVRGAIRDEWARLGWERSPLGYPVGGEFAVRDGGRVQRFTGGLVYWTPRLGAHEVRGAFGQAYAAQRWENGSLGYPRTGEQAVPGGVRREFEGGTLTYRWAEGRVTRS